jgi:hypothetical protein
MTPQEKAIQLIDAFDEYAESRKSDNGRDFDKKYCSKQCALIVVDELIKQHYYVNQWYWEEVKIEIEKL